MANLPSPLSDPLSVAVARAPVDEVPETAEERAIIEARWAEYERTGAAVPQAEVMRKIAELDVLRGMTGPVAPGTPRA